MDDALKKRAVPVLRELGFRGSYPHFYRDRDGHVDLLSFQFNKWGGSFVVEISYADPARRNLSADFAGLPAKKLRVGMTDRRLRLGSLLGEIADHWFHFDRQRLLRRSAAFDDVAERVATLVARQAVPWWEKRRAENE